VARSVGITSAAGWVILNSRAIRVDVAPKDVSFGSRARGAVRLGDTAIAGAAAVLRTVAPHHVVRFLTPLIDRNADRAVEGTALSTRPATHILGTRLAMADEEACSLVARNARIVHLRARIVVRPAACQQEPE
jgi:hypothetical protein